MTSATMLCSVNKFYFSSLYAREGNALDAFHTEAVCSVVSLSLSLYARLSVCLSIPLVLCIVLRHLTAVSLGLAS